MHLLFVPFDGAESGPVGFVIDELLDSLVPGTLLISKAKLVILGGQIVKGLILVHVPGHLEGLLGVLERLGIDLLDVFCQRENCRTQI